MRDWARKRERGVEKQRKSPPSHVLSLDSTSTVRALILQSATCICVDIINTGGFIQICVDESGDEWMHLHL